MGPRTYFDAETSSFALIVIRSEIESALKQNTRTGKEAQTNTHCSDRAVALKAVQCDSLYKIHPVLIEGRRFRAIDCCRIFSFEIVPYRVRVTILK